MCNYSEYIFEKGFEEGYKLAREKNIEILISLLCELGAGEDVIINKVCDEYDLSVEIVTEMYKNYRNS